MAHVFISYARADLDFAERLALRLQRAGLSVWWDRRLLAGADIETTIDDQIKSCGAVVVVWSSNASGSHWVRSEAAAALELHKLVPVRADDTRLPRPFDQIHTLDLSDWTGGYNKDIRVLIDSIRTAIKGKTIRKGPGKANSKMSRRRLFSIGAVASAAVVGLAVVSDLTDLIGNIADANTEKTLNSKLEKLDDRLASLTLPIEDTEGELPEARIAFALQHLRDANIPNDRAVTALLKSKTIDDAISLLEKDYRKTEAELSRTARIEWLHQIAGLLYEQYPSRAEQYYDEIILYAPDDSLAHSSLARLAYRKGFLEDAKTHLTKALQSAPPESRLKCIALIQSGYLRLFTREHSEAIALLDEAIEIAQKEDFPALISYAATYKGIALRQDGQLDEARHLLEANLQRAEALRRSREISVSLSLLGRISLSKGDHSKALDFFSRQLENELELSRAVGLSEAHENLALVHQAMGDWTASQEHFRLCTKIARENELNNFVKRCLLGSAEIEVERNQIDDGCLYFEAAKALINPTEKTSPAVQARFDAFNCPSSDHSRL